MIKKIASVILAIVTSSSFGGIWVDIDLSKNDKIFCAHEVLPSLQEHLGQWKPITLLTTESSKLFLSVESAVRNDNNVFCVFLLKNDQDVVLKFPFNYFDKGNDEDLELTIKVGEKEALINIKDNNGEGGTNVVIALGESVESLKKKMKIAINSPLWKWGISGTRF